MVFWTLFSCFGEIKELLQIKIAAIVNEEVSFEYFRYNYHKSIAFKLKLVK